MCGILAAVCKEEINTLVDYFKLIKHRGPDATDFVIPNSFGDNIISLWFHRLAINDLTFKGMQPIRHDSLFLICNGEVFNHRKLAAKYNITTYTDSDCEIIIHLYIHFGRDENALRRLLEELSAEFSFVMYDAKTSAMIAARDPFGTRGLFFDANGAEICIASEIKVLGFRTTAQPFKPGTYLFRTYKGDQYEEKVIQYFKLPTYSPAIAQEPMDIIYEDISALLKNAVNERLMSDRPLGCFLSGGLDSSLVAALVAQHKPRLDCFTVGLKNGEDIAAARKVVEHLNANGANVKHHVVLFTVEEGISLIKEVIWHLETYDITTIRASIPQYILARYISLNTDIKVLLSGEGSDEVNSSYLYNRFAPTPKELENDSARLIEELYMFDNLRVDRTTAAFGLEVRLPFLCKHYVRYMFTLDPALRMCREQIEKKLLRSAFEGEGLLPDDILYRTKAAFSDAVSSADVSWYRSIQEHIDLLISDDEFRNCSAEYIHNVPPSKEALYYRRIFDELFPGRENILKYYWMPRWVDTKGDPSATVLAAI